MSLLTDVTQQRELRQTTASRRVWLEFVDGDSIQYIRSPMERELKATYMTRSGE